LYNDSLNTNEVTVIQISDKVFCDKRLQGWGICNPILPNPYNEYPFLVIKNFFDTSLMHEIAQSIYQDSNVQKAKVKQMILNSIVDSTLNEKIRKTNIYKLDALYTQLYEKNFKFYQSQIERFFNLSLTIATPIQVLEYTQGSFYIKHSDDSNELVDKQSNTIGFACIAPQRKLTTLLFATAHQDQEASQEDAEFFSGGELLFNYLFDKEGKNILFKPQAGDMIVFPSNPYFSHEVKVVTSGYRLSLVKWSNAIIN